MSSIGASILLIKKQDKSFCLCVNYFGLNLVTSKNRHLFPLISEALDRVVDAQIHTKLNIESIYNHICVQIECRKSPTGNFYLSANKKLRNVQLQISQPTECQI